MDRTAEAAQVARALGVSPDSIGRYARSGRIPFDLTPGGHRRFNIAEVRHALAPTADAAAHAADPEPLFSVPSATRRARSLRAISTGPTEGVVVADQTADDEVPSAALELARDAWRVHRSVLIER